MELLSDRIKTARQKAGMTQGELAQLLGTHKNTIGRWERGLGEPEATAITAICDKLGINPYWLLAGEGSMLDKNREVVEVKPGMKAKDLRGYKLSEIHGGSAFDSTMANMQAKWREIAEALPDDREDADMEKAFLYHKIKLLEAELTETREELLQAKDKVIKTQEIALQVMETATSKGSQRLGLQMLEDLRAHGEYDAISEVIRALAKFFPKEKNNPNE